MQASYAANGDWQGLMKYNKSSSEPSHSAARRSRRPKAAPPDDLTQLSGIGPRISSILSDGGVTTYAELEHTDPSDLRKIIARAARCRLQPRLVADPGVVRGARRLAGPRELQQPQVASVRGPSQGRFTNTTGTLPGCGRNSSLFRVFPPISALTIPRR